MIPPKRFDIFPPTEGCSEGLDAFRFFFKQGVEWRGMARENPPKNHGGQRETGRGLSCRNRKSRKKNLDKVDADDPDHQDRNQEAKRGAQGAEGKGYRRAVERESKDINT